jgi:HAE1 family hydrophobic/amphiphilic exporter-1
VKLEFYKEGDANLVEVARGIRERIFGTPQEQEQLRHYEARRRQPAAAAAEPSDDDSKKKTTDGKNGKQIRLGRPDFLMATLPEDVRVEVMSDQSIFIQRALDEVRQTALVGGVLAIFVLYLFLRNAWFTLAVGLAIPISVIASFIALHLYDVSINMMSLGGIALGIGMLVDTSIVVLESIFRCQQEGDSPLRAAVRGTREVTGAVVASTLTTVCVFLPIIFVEGIAGQVFRDQALAVVISLVASLLVALYFLPTLVCHRPGHRSLHGGEPSMRDTDLGFRFRALARLRTRAADLRGRYCRLGNVAKVALAPCALLVPLLLFAVFLVRLLLELLGWLGTILFAAAVALGRGIGATLGRALSAPTTRVLHVWEAGFLRLAAAYERVLAYSLRHRPAVVLLVLLAAAGAFYCFTRLGSELIPQVHQGEFTAELRMPLGTRLERTDRVLMPLERRMLEQAQLLGIDSLTTTVGVEKDSIHAGDEGEHTARFLVRMRSGQNPQQVENHVKARFREILRSEAAVAGVRFRNPVLFSFKTPIEVEIRGYDLEALRRITRQVDSTLREVAALKDVTNNATTGYPEAHLHFDRDLLNRHGLTVTDVAERLRHMVQGDVPSYFSEGDRKVEMRARLREEDRDSLEELSRLVLTPEGAAAVTLRDVLLDSTGRVEVTEGPSEIRRIGGQRAGVVTANLIGMDLGHVVEQVETAVSRVKHPPDFTVGFGGQKKEMDLSIAQLRQAFLLAVFLVYVVMAVQFESLLQPLVILLAVPLAMLGVSPALWFLETPLSIVVFLGMIVLAGIVVNNAIVLISYVNQMRAQGVPLESALAAAGKIRLRPILMTTLTTILGLLPLTGLFQQIPAAQSLLGVGEGAEVRAPMAITVIAGMTATTLLTRVVVPVFYSMVARDTHHGPLDPGDAEGCSDG